MVVTGILGEKIAIEKLRKIKGIIWENLLNNKNKKDYDILGKKENGQEIKVQIKTIKKGDWSLNAEKFLKFDQGKINLKDPEQWIIGIKEDLEKKVDFFIFIYLKYFSEGEPIIKKESITIPFSHYETEFYIIKTKDLQELIKRNYSNWLIKKKNIRPINKLSFHFGLSIRDLKDYKDIWEIIK
jgi:hypothetical protein